MHCEVVSASMRPLSNPHDTRRRMSERALPYLPPFPCLRARRIDAIINERHVHVYPMFPRTLGHSLPPNFFSLPSASWLLFNRSSSLGLPLVSAYHLGMVAPQSRIHATRLGANYNHVMHPSSSARYRHSIAPARPRHRYNLELPSTTIHNHVNILKNTLRMDEDQENPGCYLLAFSFDADLPGSFHVCFLAKVGTDFSIVPWLPDIHEPMRVSFDKGCGQKFKQVSGTGIYLDAFEAKLMEEEGSDMLCPLVVQAHTISEHGHKNMVTGMDENKKFVNTQLTQAAFKRKENGHCDVCVLRQIIWVDGVQYELHDLYGAECSNLKVRSLDNFSENACVICLAEPRKIAVLPCRHMCMCKPCAAVLTSKMARCPMCRQHVDALLRIEVES